MNGKNDANELSTAADLLAHDFQDQLRRQVSRLIAAQRRERIFIATASLSASACIGLLVNELSQQRPFAQVGNAAMIVFAACLVISIATGAAALLAWGSGRALRKELLGE